MVVRRSSKNGIAAAHEHQEEGKGDEQRPLLQTGSPNNGPGSYGGIASSSNTNIAAANGPDSEHTFSRSSSIFHSWSKGSTVSRPRRNTVEIIKESRKHQIHLALFLLVTLIFTLVPIFSRARMTLGHLLTTNVLMPVTVPCPRDVRRAPVSGSEAKCKVSEIQVFRTRINYGLFGPLHYRTDSETSIHMLIKSPTGEKKTKLSRISTLVSEDVQPNYQYWSRRFPDEMVYVRTTQVTLIISASLTLLTLIILGLVTLGKPATTWARNTTFDLGFFCLVLSCASLALSCLAWTHIPLSAFTTECQPSDLVQQLVDNATYHLGSVEVTRGLICVQLDGGLCVQNCYVQNNVIRGGGMFGVVLFSCLLQGVCLMFWLAFHKEIKGAIDIDSYSGARDKASRKVGSTSCPVLAGMGGSVGIG